MEISRGNRDTSIITISGSNWATPTDATTRYIGILGLTAGAAVFNACYFPRAGVVTTVYINSIVAGTLGTTETSTFSFRLNDTSDTTITSSFQNDQSTEVFSNTSLAIVVAAGDFFEFKWVTPTWSTNPTNWFLAATLLVEH